MEDTFSKRAFAIGDMPEDFDLSAPPLTGFDYLFRVRLESRNCPKVVVSNIDKTKFLNRQTVTIDDCNGFISARPGYEPDPDWREEQLELFSENRLKLTENRDNLKQKFPRKDVPRINKKQEWCLFCLGIEKHDLVYAKDEPEVSGDNAPAANPKKARISDTSNPPLLSVMLYMNQSRVTKLLSYHIDWLEKTGFSHAQGAWLYALLVALEKPLDPDTCALLRSLSRQCSRLRNELSSSDHEFVRPLNLVLSIVAHYFDQKDMCDDFFNNK